MMKKNCICVSISAVIMILLPWLAVTLVNGDAGMAICFILFFAINPITSVIVGLFAGKNIKTSWFQPLLLAALFLAGAWLIFNMDETSFLLYAVIYLMIGSLTMLITKLLR